MLRGPDVRLRFIAALLLLVTLLMVGRLVYVQLGQHAAYKSQVDTLVYRQYTLPQPAPGRIYDRNGALLVGNIPVYNVGAEVSMIRDPQAAANKLAPILKVPFSDLVARLTPPANLDERRIVWRPLVNGVSEEQAQQLRELGLPWLTLTPSWQRTYPEKALASYILGFVNAEGKGYGVLGSQWDFLKGDQPSLEGEVTGDTSPLPDTLAQVQRASLPSAGMDLRLTIDRTVQAYVEEQARLATEQYKAEGCTIIVMDPRTGAIIAMASWPAYEPANYAEYVERGEADRFNDPAVTWLYEPGSTFKVITVAGALDSGAVNLDWSYYDAGGLEYGGIIVRNWDGRAYGQQNLQGLLAKSLNVGAATLSTRVMGPELFYRYVRAFGFGQPTGIELAGEAAGMVHMPSDWDWQDAFLATNSFGQGIAVTPLQMITAFAAVANDGVMMQPYIIAERHYPDGTVVPKMPRVLGQPISAQTAQTLSELMARAVEKEVPQAMVSGYRIAGKTGTAQIPGVGGYEQDQVIGSFIAFGPLPDPQVVVLIKIDRPGIEPWLRWGSQTAAPFFAQMAPRLFALLGIPPAQQAQNRP